MRQLPEELAKLAREELNEVPQRVPQDLQLLREWISKQKHLKARTSDAFLIAILRRCRYSLEETKKRIDNYFTSYNLFPEFMKSRRVTQRILDINRLGVHNYLEFPASNNQRAILIIRLGKVDYKNFSFREVMIFVIMAMEIIALENDNAAVAGICQIVDFQNISFEYLENANRTQMRNWFYWFLECSLLKLKEVYIINTSKEIARTLAFKINVISWKFGQIPVVMINNLEDIYKYIPKVCLPEEYGGSNGHSAECVAYMEDMLLSYRKYFEDDVNYGTCEALRSGEVMTYEAEFGASGSFRKLFSDD